MFFEKIENVTRIRIGFVLRVISYTNPKDCVISSEERGRDVVEITSIRYYWSRGKEDICELAS